MVACSRSLDSSLQVVWFSSPKHQYFSAPLRRRREVGFCTASVRLSSATLPAADRRNHQPFLGFVDVTHWAFSPILAYIAALGLRIHQIPRRKPLRTGFRNVAPWCTPSVDLVVHVHGCGFRSADRPAPLKISIERSSVVSANLLPGRRVPSDSRCPRAAFLLSHGDEFAVASDTILLQISVQSAHVDVSRSIGRDGASR